MTETKERTIAEIVRDGRQPKSELFQLANQAARLNRSIKVAEKWVDSAFDAEIPDAMLAKAEQTRDELVEELSRVAFRMEVVRAEQAEKAVDEERPEEERIENLDAMAYACQLGDSLMQVYCVLEEAPVDVFGIEGSEATPATRYSLMGALLAAVEAANEEVKRLEPRAKV